MAGRMETDPPHVSIEDVFRRAGANRQDYLIGQLIEREQNLADLLREKAEQWGLHPPIVAEALAAIGIGRPLSDEERVYIHTAFHRHIESLQGDN